MIATSGATVMVAEFGPLGVMRVIVVGLRNGAPLTSMPTCRPALGVTLFICAELMVVEPVPIIGTARSNDTIVPSPRPGVPIWLRYIEDAQRSTAITVKKFMAIPGGSGPGISMPMKPPGGVAPWNIKAGDAP